jgi:protein-disulfide isomerase
VIRPGLIAGIAVAAVAVAVAFTTHGSQLSVKLSNGAPTRGREDAPVTLLEFTDYQCPYCRAFHDHTWPELKRTFVDTGKLQFVLLDLPLDFHAHAEPAAEAAHCAGAQSGYWAMHDALFAGGGLDPSAIEQLARDQGLDLARFNACLESHRYRQEIEENARLAHSLGLDGTPSFILGTVKDGVLHGEALEGALSAEEFEAHITEALARH